MTEEIDQRAATYENLIRLNLTAAQEIAAIARRAELIKAKNALGSVSNDTKHKSGGRPKEPASMRDLAAKTGRSVKSVHRAMKRAEALGTETLERVVGTSLDTPSRLDGLAAFPEPLRQAAVDLIQASTAAPR